MNFALEPARSGELSARIGSIRIHSAYDPEREASRFIDTQNLDMRQGATVIVVGAGLGYLDRELKRRRPDLTILAFHLVPQLLRGVLKPGSGVRRWNPADETAAADFIFSNLGELDAPGLRILEWRPSIQAAPEAAAAVKSAVAAVVRRYSGNITTTAAFGRRWIRNTLRNFAETDYLVRPRRPPGTTLVAASGPSLEGALPALKRNRRRFALWALPSALPALAYAGIRPDLVLTGDPGFWAGIHWRSFPCGVPAAMPLSAAPHPESPAEIFLLVHGTPEENDLLTEKEWRGLQIPQTGSVAIAAVETWKRLSGGPLVFVGLDLGWLNLRGHARPHAFDGWLGTFESRLKPSLTVAWERASRIAPNRVGVFRTGPSLQTYADWFRAAGLPQSVYRFRHRGDSPPPAALPAVGEFDEADLASLPDEPPPSYERIRAPLSRRERIGRIRRVLNRWGSAVEECASGEELMKSNLVYTLDPGGALGLRRLDAAAGEADRDEVRGRVGRIIRDLAGQYE